LEADPALSKGAPIVIAVEWCIDIANHVIASESYRFPRDNADSFAVLVAEHKCGSHTAGGAAVGLRRNAFDPADRLVRERDVDSSAGSPRYDVRSR